MKYQALYISLKNYNNINFRMSSDTNLLRFFRVKISSDTFLHITVHFYLIVTNYDTLMVGLEGMQNHISIG